LLDVRKVLIALVASCASFAARAEGQAFWGPCTGDFHPLSDTSLNTNSNQGRLDFMDVHIPAGVTVTVTGWNPLRLFAAGNVLIEGNLVADGQPGLDPTIIGCLGAGCGGGVVAGGGPGGWGGFPGTPPTIGLRGDGLWPGCGGHPAGFECSGTSTSPGKGGAGGGFGDALGGTAQPGGACGCNAGAPQGSPAGDAFNAATKAGGGGGGGGAGRTNGGSGGGSSGGGIFITAAGNIVVSGTISARGGDGGAGLGDAGAGGGGSGGAILLRSFMAVTIADTATLDAMGGQGGAAIDPVSEGGDGGEGRIRVEDSSGMPVLDGTVVPDPSVGPALLVIQGQLGIGQPVTASNFSPVGPPSKAFNGRYLWDDAWNAGGPPPQEIEIDLGKPTRIARVVLSPDISPLTGIGSQEIWVSPDGTNYTLAWSNTMAPIALWVSIIADFTGAPLEGVRFLRLVTTQGPCCPPSWVAWTEIEVQEAVNPTAFGCGCPGSGGVVPRLLAAGGPPSVGNATFGYTVRRALGDTACLLFLGVSDVAWLGGPLPLEVPQLPGCYLFTGFQAIWGIETTSGAGPGDGEANFQVPIPNEPAFAGLKIYFQALVADPAAGTLGVALTNGERLEITP
jgi:hypothetical protein